MPSKKASDLPAGICPTISVGMLTANLLSLGSELAILEQTEVDAFACEGDALCE